MPPRVKVTDDAVTRVKKTGQMERPVMPMHEEMMSENDSAMADCMENNSHEQCVRMMRMKKRGSKTMPKRKAMM
jgi:hypothetical protein